MPTNHHREEDQDTAILQVLDGNAADFGLEPSTIGFLTLRFLGARMDEADVKKRINYLLDLNLVKRVEPGKFHSEIRRYRITAEGINYLRERNL